MAGAENPRPQPPSTHHTGSSTHQSENLQQIGAAVDNARHPAPGQVGSVQFLVALAMLRQLREHIGAWEPELIDAARAHGASWAQLAPALGVASRQAAERRALRLRPGDDPAASTGDQRVRAERDKRAGRRAATAWARNNAADLRQLAGQITALDTLPPTAHQDIAHLRTALGSDDPAHLLTPLADTRPHLQTDHPDLTARIDTLLQRATGPDPTRR